MSLVALSCLLVGLVIVVFMLQFAFLRQGARVARIPGVTVWRTIAACACFLAFGMVVTGVNFAVGKFLGLPRTPPLAALSLGLLLLAIELALPCLLLKWLWRTSFWRAGGAYLICLVGTSTSAYILALGLRALVMEAFVVPTGAMAPTIYGRHSEVVCTNCGLAYAISMSFDPDGRGMDATTTCPNCENPNALPSKISALSGDRLLVDKTMRPKRWDLIVFRYPEDPTTNYIKRLVGMPGETLEIVDGDLFVDGRRLQKGPGEALDMWLPVHDTRHAPKEPVRDGPRWAPAKPSSAWKADTGKWVFSGLAADEDELRFSGRLTDELAYNQGPVPGIGEPSPMVGDAQIQCCVEQFSGDGKLAFQWEFRGKRITAKVAPDGKVELGAADTDTKDAGAVTHGQLPDIIASEEPLVFAIRDGQAYVAQGGKVAASCAVGPQDLKAAKKSAGPPSEPCKLTVAARHCSLVLSRIVLSKDVYYRNLSQLGGGFPSEPQYGCQDRPITLGPGQYFTLGDNSARSKDSRFWGVVPESHLTGVARWIYWPRGRWHEFR